MKRLFDITVALTLLLLTTPILAVAAVLVWTTMGRPVLFRQPRAGLHGRQFELVKLRSMSGARDTDGNLLPNAQRLTALGHMLRMTSIDELPSLWNVIRGDMSLVGPRPLLMEYLPLYSPEQARRHLVRPGITGWAQVHGRNSLPWHERFALDVWYVDHRGMTLDLLILLKTVGQVVSRRGINADGEVGMPRFDGQASHHDLR